MKRHKLIFYLVFILFTILVITPQAHSASDIDNFNIYQKETWYSFFNNIGWPLALMILPGFLMLLFPISFIKSFVFQRYLPKTSFKKIFWPIIATSLLSTTIGILLVWGLFFVLKITSQVMAIDNQSVDLPTKLIRELTIESPLLTPFQSLIPYMQWLISIILAFLIIPFYCISGWLEGVILIKFKAFSNKNLVKKTSWKANLASYLFLLLIGLGFILWLYIKSLAI